jgi:hypothetical protein
VNLRRFSRQLILKAVGAAGQEKILSSTLVLPAEAEPGCASAARVYALGAGYAAVIEEIRSYPEATRALGNEFRHAASRQLAEGAHLVFSDLHRLLELSQSHGATGKR